jgi:predicted AAA+ superfamily ATPase
VLSARLDETAVVRLSGPRAAGKTTSCVAEATRRGGSIVRLDDPDELVAVAFDPSGYLAGLPAPILIDEYHRVPDVLDVIKADLSRAPATPGRWLLCGSVSIGAVATAANSLGGRLTDVAMGTLTLDERNDLAEPEFLLRLVRERAGVLRGWRPNQAFERAGLLAEAVRGGFPLVTDREVPAAAWLR